MIRSAAGVLVTCTDSAVMASVPAELSVCVLRHA
jgi:hypothetical protein